MPENPHICPVERAGGLDNIFRRWLQNPRRLLKPYIKPGTTVLDLGCGPGFFTIEMARLLNGTGKVVAADVQEGMLDKVQSKISGKAFSRNIVLHQCNTGSTGLNERVDFVLAFYMVHEVPDQIKLFDELKSLLKPRGRLLIVEPKFHVSKAAFATMLETLRHAGFRIIDQPRVLFSRAVLLENRP